MNAPWSFSLAAAPMMRCAMRRISCSCDCCARRSVIAIGLIRNEKPSFVVTSMTASILLCFLRVSRRM